MPLRRFAAAALALVALTLASRVPLGGDYLFSWDAANFAFGLDDYNVAAHRPHPPGYPLYIASAWLLRAVLGDANAAFLALSILASSGAAVLLAGLAWRLMGPRGAAISSAFFLTSPNTWGHGLVAYPYTFLALVATATAWIAVETRWGGRNLAVLGAVILGVGAGFRPDLLLLLGPVWFYGASARGRATLGAGVAAGAVAVLLWLVPAVERSGGWQAYSLASAEYAAYWTVATDSLPGFVAGVRRNMNTLLGYLYQTTGPMLALLLIYGVGRVLSPPAVREQPRLLLLPVWCLPPLLFYGLVHIGNLGYLLTVVPALALLASAATSALAQDLASVLPSRVRARPLLAGIVGAAVAANTALFLALSGPVSLREVRDVDAELAGALAVIRSLPRESTAVVSFDRFRQFEYYLPGRKREGRVLSGLAMLGTAPPGETRVTVVPPRGVDTLVLPDLYENTSDRREGLRRVRVTRDVDVFIARVRPGERLRLGYHYARVLPAAS